MRQTIERVDHPFYAPFAEVLLIKGVEENGQWIVYLEASNELKDQDKEVVDQAALKKAADYYLSHGIISWDHKHKQTNDPKYIIGEPLDVRFTEDKRTLVKGFLYKMNDIAKSVWKNIRSAATRLGASIGGGILEKAEEHIHQVIWDEIALTHKPINDGTLGSVQLIPFDAFAKALSFSEGNTDLEDFIKALTAGSGVDASKFTGGRALIPESLQGATVKYIVKKEELDDLFKSLMIDMIKGRVRNYNDLTNYVLDRGYSNGIAERIINHVAQNLSLKQI